MACEILNKDIWQMLLESRLTEKQKKTLHAHLLSDCSDCEEFLRDINEEEFEIALSLLDKEVKDNTWSGKITRDEHNRFNEISDVDKPKLSKKENDEMFDRILGAVLPEKGLGNTKTGYRINMKFYLATASIAAVLLLGFSITTYNKIKLYKSNEKVKPYTGIKGSQEKAGSKIDLQFLVVKKGEDNTVSEERGVNEGRYSQQQDILFRYEVNDEGYVYLLNFNKNDMDVFYPFELTSPKINEGSYDLEKNGVIQGYSLKNLTGEQYFLALFSRKPMLKDQIIDIFKTREWLVDDEINIDKLVSLFQDASVDYFKVYIGP